MCSDVCPCEPGLSDWKETQTSFCGCDLSKFNRVIDETELTPNQTKEFKEKSYNADVVPFVWKEGGMTSVS